MPKGYLIFTEEIRDQERYQAYLQKALPTVLGSGGRPIVVEDDPEVLEGKWYAGRTVVLEFESVQAIKDWYNSPEYQALIDERLASTDGNAVIVGEFEMPGG